MRAHEFSNRKVHNKDNPPMSNLECTIRHHAPLAVHADSLNMQSALFLQSSRCELHRRRMSDIHEPCTALPFLELTIESHDYLLDTRFYNARHEWETNVPGSTVVIRIDDQVAREFCPRMAQNRSRLYPFRSYDIAEELEIDHKTDLTYLKKAGYTKSSMPESHTSSLTSNETELFLKRLITNDKKWITYDKKKISRSKSKQASQIIAKPGLTRNKLIKVWWDWNSIIRCKLLPPGKTINSDIYCRQLMRFE
ncbi:Histone-lysine N-methyltransferase SETMAR [Eumeta japonica]|uniref:Histone-lysine N-methyltransferase SETMAR n=1 Tax=Eumeta variegata TaxID=151549 RepID=A0A4C1U744_EUMVA|nr:Histone-lysine N-methyltransferase SETMAR [Eumeta japonica]